MAKAKTNKSQIIRDALQAHPDKSNSEISELLKLQGLKIKPQYISTIKGNAKKKRRLKRKGKAMLRGPARGIQVGNGMAAVPAALEFIKSVGGLEAARNALTTIEEIGKVVH